MLPDNSSKPQITIPEVWEGHYHKLIEALTVAMQHCWVWRRNGTGQTITLKELYELAERFDKENPLKRPQFFIVSREGAIGFSEGYEFLTKWWYLPMEPGPEREKLIEDMRWALKADSEAKKAVERAANDMIEASRRKTVQCPRCGKLVEVYNGMRFCSSCGCQLPTPPSPNR